MQVFFFVVGGGVVQILQLTSQTLLYVIRIRLQLLLMLLCVLWLLSQCFATLFSSCYVRSFSLSSLFSFSLNFDSNSLARFFAIVRYMTSISSKH